MFHEVFSGDFLSDPTFVDPKSPVSPDPTIWWEKPVLTAARLLPGLSTVSLSKTFRKAVHGSTWTLIGYGSTQLARLVTTVLLARMLLGPKEFGLVALVNVFLTGLEMLTDLGIGMDVIQHVRGDDQDFINTAFLIQAGRGLILWGVAMALAYPFAIFYKQPAILWLAIVGAASTGLRGFTSGSVWTMTRHVQLRKLTLLTAGGEAAGLLIAFIWAIVSPSAWALVVGRVASSLFFVVGTHLVAEYPVSTRWDSAAAKDILAFGTGIFLSTSIYFLTGEAERLVVGKFVNLVELGCFSLALTICAAATTGLTQIINQVFFPMIAQSVREDRNKVARNFRSVRLLLLLVCAVLVVGFIGGSRWIVALLLGPKYVMTGWILQLLGARAALQLFISIDSSMLFAVGTSKYHAVGNTAKLLFMAVGLGIAFAHFGFREAIWVLAVSPIAAYVALLFGLARHFRSVMRVELASFGALLACSVLTAAIVHILP
jgi:O-antigen/teichoic acid export membrane protein